MIATSQVLKRRDVLGMMLALEPSLSPQREKGIPCQWFGKIYLVVISVRDVRRCHCTQRLDVSLPVKLQSLGV
jgi:hypothetical protein